MDKSPASRCGDDVDDDVLRELESMPEHYGRDEFEAEWRERGGYHDRDRS